MKRALVLSGGGAKGAYQIGAYKALTKLGFKFDIICGTSIGAINAAAFTEAGYLKAWFLWHNLQTSDLFDVKKNISEKEMYKVFVTQFFENKGLSFDKTEAFLKKHLSERKIRKSKKDLGIVTYSVTTKKPKSLTKDDIPEGKIIDYIIASSTCFPAVRAKKIDNETYIDGGYYDNLPINLAIKMGATNIVAIDLSVMAFEKKVKNTDVYIDIIKCKDNKAFTINFTKEYTKKFIKYGYNDVMKYYGNLDGNIYTFKKDDLEKNYYRIEESFIDIITSMISIDKKNILSKEIFKLTKYNNLFTNIKQKRSIKESVDEAIEYLGKTFEIDESKIYKISEYNKIILKKLELLKNTKLDKNLKGKLLIGYIFNKYFSNESTENISKELFNIALLFKNEFLSAIYLIAIYNKYNLTPKRHWFKIKN